MPLTRIGKCRGFAVAHAGPDNQRAFTCNPAGHFNNTRGSQSTISGQITNDPSTTT